MTLTTWVVGQLAAPKIAAVVSVLRRSSRVGRRVLGPVPAVLIPVPLRDLLGREDVPPLQLVRVRTGGVDAPPRQPVLIRQQAVDTL